MEQGGKVVEAIITYHRRRNVLEAGGAQEVPIINYKLILVNNY